MKHCLFFLLSALPAVAAPQVYDLVVYGGTSAGVTAAVQARKMGRSAVIVCPDKHLGGLSAGGLGFTDTGNKKVIGGLSREFYHRVWLEYKKPEAWKWQRRGEFGNRGQGTVAIDGEMRTMWIFEPHVAEKVFEDFVKEHRIPVHRDEWLNRAPDWGVAKKNGRISAITMLSGRTYSGRMFVDATYEGDLMAAAGVQYHVGRESRETYGEQWNGVQVGVLHHGHHFGAVKKKISAYRVPGDPTSGVLPRISTEPPGEYGAADRKVQAYCYRMCLTDHPANRVPFPKPAGYDAGQYELLLRIFDAGWRQGFRKFDLLPNHKTDTNNHGPFSTDNIGRNYDYPEASYARRAEILREHEVYQKGLMYFVANDPRMPADVRQLMNCWGLAKDEFVDNGNWPHQIYVREARRMIGKYMMTENELLKKRPTPEPVGMGSYTMDSHNVQRYITPDGLVQNEGDIGVSTRGPYQIAYGSLVPQKAQCENLLVPVCLSSSHIAFGSIRMEPVFMILGQSAATAAVLSLDAGLAVQDLPYEKLRTRLRADGQVLSASPYIFKLPARLAGIVIDDTQAKLEGNWHPSTSSKSFIGKSYRHDGNMDKGKAKAIFEARLKPGRYEVRIAYTPHANRATNAPVIVRHSGGVTAKRINQRRKPSHDESTESIGIFEFENTATVEVRNHGTDGYVTIDAVQFIPASKSK